MTDRVATERESQMVDFLQEASSRVVHGQVTGVCLIVMGPNGEESDWFFTSKAEQARLVGVTGMAWQAMTLEANVGEECDVSGN